MDGIKADKAKRAIIEKGVKQLLAESQVPLHLHLKVVRELRKALDNHKADQTEWKGLLQKHKEGDASHEELIKMHREQVSALTEELVRIASKDWTGPQGDPGVNAEPAKEVDIEKLASLVLSRIPLPKDGNDGQPGKDAETPATDKLVEAVITRVQKGDVLHINHVKGASGFIKDGIRYRFEELMHGSGSGGGALAGTQEKSTTIPNGVLTSFAFAHTPKVIVWNGAVQTLADDYTISGSSITFTMSAGIPQTGDKILNIYG